MEKEVNNKEDGKNLFKVLKDKFILAPFKYLTVFLAGVIFASGLVYAWEAAWHGTDWIESGAVIESKKLGESLQYLYEQVDDLKNQITNLQTTVDNATTTNITIDQMPSGTVVAGCIPSTEGMVATWKCWGGASGYRTDGYDLRCPNNTFEFKIINTTGSYIDSGDGNQFTAYHTQVTGMLCIKE